MRSTLVIFAVLAFFLGYMTSERFSAPEPLKFKNTPYCLHSEYSSMKALRELKRPVNDALVDVGKTVRVWVPCEA